MKNFQSKLFFVFLTGVFLLSACGRSGNTNQANGANQTANGANSNANATKDDAEEFGKLVNLTLLPEDVSWRETDKNNVRKLIAVLKYSSADAQNIVAQAERHKPSAPAEIDAENWFPPELIAKSQESGEEILKGTSYAANDFFSETYKTGKLTRINDTDYFVLELASQ